MLICPYPNHWEVPFAMLVNVAWRSVHMPYSSRFALMEVPVAMPVEFARWVLPCSSRCCLDECPVSALAQSPNLQERRAMRVEFFSTKPCSIAVIELSRSFPCYYSTRPEFLFLFEIMLSWDDVPDFLLVDAVESWEARRELDHRTIW